MPKACTVRCARNSGQNAKRGVANRSDGSRRRSASPCRRLLLQRLSEFLFQIGVGCAKPVNVSSRPRCLRTRPVMGVGLFAPLRDKITSSAQPLVHLPAQRRIELINTNRTARAEGRWTIHSITSSARASSLYCQQNCHRTVGPLRSAIPGKLWRRLSARRSPALCCATEP
jgi:hypothetical protein